MPITLIIIDRISENKSFLLYQAIVNDYDLLLFFVKYSAMRP